VGQFWGTKFSARSRGGRHRPSEGNRRDTPPRKLLRGPVRHEPCRGCFFRWGEGGGEIPHKRAGSLRATAAHARRASSNPGGSNLLQGPHPSPIDTQVSMGLGGGPLPCLSTPRNRHIPAGSGPPTATVEPYPDTWHTLVERSAYRGLPGAPSFNH